MYRQMISRNYFRTDRGMLMSLNMQCVVGAMGKQSLYCSKNYNLINC